MNQNSGDTRHRGFEGQISYDFLAARGGDLHLTAFGNLSLLDAEFIDSKLANRIGNTPAFAPDVIAKYGISLRRDARYNFSLTGTTVSEQYFQDSNTAGGSGASFVPAKVPAYTVIDFSADYYVNSHIRLVGGVSNFGDEKYYVRVFQNGIEPASGRKFYAGVAIGL